MTTRSPSPRVVGGLLVAVLMTGAGSIGRAQQPPLRPGQTPGPKFIISALKGEGDGPRLGFQVANAVRERIASDFDMRSLWVVPESTITDYLRQAGYPPDQPLSPTEMGQLVSSFSAQESLNGVVIKTPTGGYRVQAAWSLAPRGDMVQPLPTVEATKISDLAKLVAHEFQTARKQVESVQRCVNLARARNYAGALAEARKAIDVYPKSVLGRVCIANIYDQQKAGADSMIRISEEILAIHPENARALAFAADAYGAKEMVDDRIRVLKELVRVEPTNHRARIELIKALAARGQMESAKELVDSTVAQEPTNVEAVTLQMRIHLGLKDWARAVEIGERLVELDSSLTTHDFFIRMIGAADAANDSLKALDLATRGVGKFPTDDELVALRVQYLRRNGQLTQALAVVNGLVGRNPRAPNAWTQKARIELALGLGADIVIATLGQGLTNGDDRAAIARYARSFGSASARDTVPNKLDPLRTALRYLKFSASAQAGDTTSYFIGNTSLVLGARLANDPAAVKRCETAKEIQSLAVDAQIELPKAGRVNQVEVPKLMQRALELGAYADQLVRAVCR